MSKIKVPKIAILPTFTIILSLLLSIAVFSDKYITTEEAARIAVFCAEKGISGCDDEMNVNFQRWSEIKEKYPEINVNEYEKIWRQVDEAMFEPKDVAYFCKKKGIAECSDAAALKGKIWNEVEPILTKHDLKKSDYEYDKEFEDRMKEKIETVTPEKLANYKKNIESMAAKAGLSGKDYIVKQWTKMLNEFHYHPVYGSYTPELYADRDTKLALLFAAGGTAYPEAIEELKSKIEKGEVKINPRLQESMFKTEIPTTLLPPETETTIEAHQTDKGQRVYYNYETDKYYSDPQGKNEIAAPSESIPIWAAPEKPKIILTPQYATDITQITSSEGTSYEITYDYEACKLCSASTILKYSFGKGNLPEKISVKGNPYVLYKGKYYASWDMDIEGKPKKGAKYLKMFEDTQISVYDLPEPPSEKSGAVKKATKLTVEEEPLIDKAAELGIDLETMTPTAKELAEYGLKKSICSESMQKCEYFGFKQEILQKEPAYVFVEKPPVELTTSSEEATLVLDDPILGQAKFTKIGTDKWKCEGSSAYCEEDIELTDLDIQAYADIAAKSEDITMKDIKEKEITMEDVAAVKAYKPEEVGIVTEETKKKIQKSLQMEGMGPQLASAPGKCTTMLA